jgi:hypothetical protein
VTGRSPVRRSSTERGVSVCDPETSIMRRLRPTRAVKASKIYISQKINIRSDNLIVFLLYTVVNGKYGHKTRIVCLRYV